MAQVEWALEWYTTTAGEQPAKKFLDDLNDRRHKKDALTLLTLARRWGNQLPREKAAPIEAGLFELRGHQVRLFFVFRPNRRIIILGGEVKKQDKIPQDALNRVRAQRRDLERREAEAKTRSR